MHSLLISDLHLAAQRPAITAQFLALTQSTTARTAAAFYILGDLFEYWAGDDDDDPLNASVAEALRALADSGTAVYLMHGNRDVLIGQDFVARAGVALLEDPVVHDLHGTPTLLSHGDAWCTGDIEYQHFRRYARDPENQRRFLAQPLAARREQMLGMRAQSEVDKQRKDDGIMDVSSAAIETAFRDAGVSRIIHGHTHRPACHRLSVDGRTCERWVLADWYRQGSGLRCDSQGCQSITI
jgi:UDP-2,3-diacylglucosamine hydrolase